MRRLITLVCVVASVYALFSANTNKQEVDNKSKKSTAKSSIQQIELDAFPKHLEAWKTIPDFLTDLPFEFAADFNTPDDENAVFDYLHALLEIEFSNHVYFKVLRELDEKKLEELQNESRQHAEQLFDFLFDELDKNEVPFHLSDAERKKACSLLEPYKHVYNRLVDAQKKPKNFIHSDFSFDYISTHQFTLRKVPRILALEFQLNSQPTGLTSAQTDYLRTALRMKRDFMSFGEATIQFSLSAVETTCLDEMVLPALKYLKLTTKELKSLINTLDEHRTSQPNMLVEAAKYEYLAFACLFDQIQSGQYATAERLKDNSLSADSGPLSLVYRQLLDCYEYSINSERVIKFIRQLASENETIKAALDKFESDPNVDLEDGARMLSVLLIQPPFTQPKATDFSIDLGILRTRHKQLAEAAINDDLKQIEQFLLSWGPAGTVENTTLIKLFKPTRLLYSAYKRGATRLNAVLCLASMQLQLLQTNTFENVKSAARNAGLANVTLDYYSGKPLRTRVTENEIVVYSVGPDGVDNGGKSEYDYQSKTGDFIFRVDRAQQ